MAIPNQAQTSFGGEDVLSDDGVVGENDLTDFDYDRRDPDA